jgi:hypothetical protein
MPLHLVKLCVGAQSVEDLAAWQAERLAQMKAEGQRRPRLFHRTFQRPKRDAEILDGGSLYWVMKGTITVRQPIVGFDEGTKADGRPCCLILLDKALIPVRPTPRRAFQGWRYLSADDAPPDIGAREADSLAKMHPEMRRSLTELGLI